MICHFGLHRAMIILSTCLITKKLWICYCYFWFSATFGSDSLARKMFRDYRSASTWCVWRCDMLTSLTDLWMFGNNILKIKRVWCGIFSSFLNTRMWVNLLGYGFSWLVITNFRVLRLLYVWCFVNWSKIFPQKLLKSFQWIFRFYTNL